MNTIPIYPVDQQKRVLSYAGLLFVVGVIFLTAMFFSSDGNRYVMLGSMAFMAFIWGILWSFDGSRKVIFEIDDRQMTIRKDLFGRIIPIVDLELDKAKVLNLRENDEYMLKWRTWGVGLPHYISGWFRLNNKQKALVFITDYTNVLYIPTVQDYALMISVENPQEFIAKLKSSR